MFRSSFRRLPLSLVVTVVLILSALMAGCSQQSNRSPSTPVSSKSSPSPSASPLRSAACTQPKPAPGKLSLAGLAYGPSHTGQDPTIGVFPSDEEVNADMPTIASLTNYIRIYSSIGPANAIIQAAEAAHVCVALGISLGRDPAANAAEMMAGELLASNTAVHAIIVGNEALLRGDLSAEQLCAAVEQVRAQLGRTIPITVADDYKEWLTHPQLAKCVDFVTVHIYPFWEGKSIDSAIPFLDAVYKAIQADYPGKPIVIGETGWPDTGPSRKDAVPSAVNQARYLRDFTNWAQQNNVQYFYFEAFDEGWKIQEHGVGTHWGLYQQDGTIKPGLSGMLPSAATSTLIQRSYRDVYVGSGLEKPFSLGIDTSNQQRNWLMDKHGSLLLNYPANQQWGGMFITAGPAAPPGQRLSLDLSAYHSLLVDMRAGADGQCVLLGIKDRTQPDDGSELKIQQCLTTQWSTITLPLNKFAHVDLAHLYVVFEILFQGATGVTVELRNIRYSPMQP
jgi:exo-beta-1,3-glucanase (GH17 family)